MEFNLSGGHHLRRSAPGARRFQQRLFSRDSLLRKRWTPPTHSELRSRVKSARSGGCRTTGASACRPRRWSGPWRARRAWRLAARFRPGRSW